MRELIKKYMLLIVALLFASNIQAQNKKIIDRPAPPLEGVAELKVGDMLPNTKLGKLINSTKQSIQTVDFNDRLLILDFWDTSCGSCISAMPKMGELQKTFGSKISILTVTWEEQERIREFWKENPNTKNVDLPGIVEDTILHTYFRHHFVPHEVWVYKGKVIGITDAQHVDEENIKAVLEGGRPILTLKYDYYPAFDTSKPLFKKDPVQIGGNTSIRYAAIGDYKPGFAPGGWNAGEGIVRDSINKSIRVYLVNSPIWVTYMMYLQRVYNRKQMLTPAFLGKPNLMVWEVADRLKYRIPLNGFAAKAKVSGYRKAWIEDHSICFEGMYPDQGQSNEQVYRAVIKDLNRLLGLNVRWEKRKEKVYVIKDKIGNRSAQKKKSSGRTGINLNELVWYWNEKEDYPYLFDESKKADKDLRMQIDTTDMLHNISALRLKFAAYGLELKEEIRLVDKVIFSEINGGMVLDGKAKATAVAEKTAQKGMPGPTPEEGLAFLNANKSKPGVVVLPSGLQYKILKKGTGALPDSTSKVTTCYKGTLVNGKVFDSSDLKGRPLSFVVKDMIKGWKEALQLMPAGSKWELYVPSELGYGTHSNSGQLPRSSVLVFEIELLQVEKSGGLAK